MRRRARIYLAFLGALLCTGAATTAQQTGSVRGVVHDDDFGTPLAGVRVSIAETGQEAATADQGNYVIEGVEPGNYNLVFAKEGYTRRVKSNVVVTAGQLTDVDASLTGDFTEMSEFVVQDLMLDPGSEAALLDLRLDSPSMLDSIGSDLISQAGASDASGALRLVAGATVQEDKAVIRGLPDRYVSSQLNGVRLPSADQESRSVQLDQFPSSVIESIQVSKTFTPDQQGDASGGAVNVMTESIPEGPIFELGIGTGFNTQAVRRDDFLTYEDGGVGFLGIDDERGDQSLPHLNDLSNTALGVSRDNAPAEYSLDLTLGGRHEFDTGAAIGGFVSTFYDRSADFHDNGRDDSLGLREPDGGTPTPVFSGTAGERRTSLLDVTQGSEQVQWGGLASFGLESEHHDLGFMILHTRTTEDTATLAEDTRGKHFFHPGHDPDDPTTPGHDDDILDAPYQRLETLRFVERTLQTVQFNGTHTLPVPEFGLGDILRTRAPEIGWNAAFNTAEEDEPDKRQFGSKWIPRQPEETFTIGGETFVREAIPARHQILRPGTGFTLGNIQRTFETVSEDGQQYAGHLKLPFEQWTGDEGYLKLGLFDDSVERTFEQESYSNFFDSSLPSGEIFFEAPFEDLFSEAWPGLENTNDIEPFDGDIDYDGTYDIRAWYWMADLPLTPWLKTIGGMRFESTDISVATAPERNAALVGPGGSRITPWEDFEDGVRATDPETGLPLGDAEFQRDDVLPSVALVLTPRDEVTLRASYTETLARQTFRELTPIQQQEFLGGDVFIGNPRLEAASVKNYDLRLDYRPFRGSLISGSVFRKDITDPIEIVQRITSDGSFIFDRPVNFPEGRMDGVELEARQQLGEVADWLTGLSVGFNATLLDSQVQLPGDEIDKLDAELGRSDAITERDMVNAPDYLLNFNIAYEYEPSGTRLGLFYTRQGDTLVAGPGISNSFFVPSRYREGFGTLNFTLSQKLGEYFKLSFKAKNLTNPKIREVYRSDFSDEAVHSSYTKGIDLSIGLSAEISF